MILEKLKLVPNEPGCYLMKNKNGVIIYVGKAKKLKNRLNSYFHSKHTGKTAKLVNEIYDFEYIVVSSETESLILEMNLIKKHDPKYNVLLRDDKSYPYIELTDDEVPRLSIVRNVKQRKNKSRLFGPYPNVTAAKTTVNLLNRIYPLRKCTVYNKRPCLYYHIGQCLGFCVNGVEKEKIKNMENSIIKFLKGDSDEIISKIKSEIEVESEKMNYEKALELKEMLDYINITLIKQKVEINDETFRDVFGYYSDENYLSVFVFFIRNSKIQGHHYNILPLVDSKEEVFTRYIASFYDKQVLPKEILVANIVDTDILEKYLKISVKCPIKGVKKQLIQMANDNAKKKLLAKKTLIIKEEERTRGANEELKKLLSLDVLDRIEIFDNAHLFGTYNVSGMVVFIDGLPAKKEYRKYKISVDKNDDYNTMREVIYRRYFRVLKDNLSMPDLIIVDGGIGQMNAAQEVLESLNLNIKLVGLKKDEKHLTSSLITADGEINIEKRTNLFHYLERMQDEVHKFTINYHKQIRSKGLYASSLDDIVGIGEKRKKELLKKFKTIENIKSADLKDLQTILPKKLAEQLKQNLGE